MEAQEGEEPREEGTKKKGRPQKPKPQKEEKTRKPPGRKPKTEGKRIKQPNREHPPPVIYDPNLINCFLDFSDN